MSFKSIFNIHILRDIQRIGDEGYRGVQDLISDMILNIEKNIMYTGRVGDRAEEVYKT